MAALSMLRLNQSYNLLCISTVPCSVPGRNISKRKLLNQLSLPVQPKRPPTPFGLFIQEIKDNLKNQDPEGKGEGFIKKSAVLWKELSPEKKEKYQNKFKALQDKYSRELKKFEETLTPEQKSQLQTFSVHYQNVKEVHNQMSMKRAKEKEFNKPKYPTTPYVRFVVNMKLGVMSTSEAWKLAKEKWRQLPDQAKEKYLSAFNEELKQYKKDLLAWEQEMISKGHTDIVRSKTLKDKIGSNKA